MTPLFFFFVMRSSAFVGEPRTSSPAGATRTGFGEHVVTNLGVTAIPRNLQVRVMKSFALVTLLLLCAADAQRGSPPRDVPFRCEGAFFALSVADLAASRDWYREKLGLDVVMEAPPRSGAQVAVLEGGGLIVELLQLDQARPLGTVAPGVTSPQLVHGIFKAGMIVKDLGATLARLRERGVEIAFGPYPASDTQRANAIVRDNAGNLIQLFGA